MQIPETKDASASLQDSISDVINPANVEGSTGTRTVPEGRLQQTIRRAEFWSNETATYLEILNVIGRWQTHDDFYVRTEFAEVGYREEDERQAATQKRHEMALRMRCVERVALQQNIPKLPFKDAALAASVGMSCADFDAIEVTQSACNIVYDALAESKSSLVPYAVTDARRTGWVTESGELNELNFRAGLYKARGLVIMSWFLFGKGNFVWVLLCVQFLHDWRPDLFPTPKELNLDKIGAVI